jgi:GT2 family glycosyltransferase
MMGKRKVIEALGGFDPRFFMYAEDIDLCFRAARAGYTNYFVPKAVVVHHGGRCSGSAGDEIRAVRMRSAVYELLKAHRGPGYASAYRLSCLLNAAVRLPAILAMFAFAGMNHETGGAERALKKWMAVARWSCGIALAARSSKTK